MSYKSIGYALVLLGVAAGTVQVILAVNYVQAAQRLNETHLRSLSGNMATFLIAISPATLSALFAIVAGTAFIIYEIVSRNKLKVVHSKAA